jgi:FtsH-binding integral membrane protein
MEFAHARPIRGAVATLGVSDRVSFLRKTYAHLGVSLLAFAALTGLLFKYAPGLTWKLSTLFGTSVMAMIGLVVVLVLMMYGAQWLARNENSRGLQYAGLALGIALQTFLLLPLIWVLMIKFSGTPMAVHLESIHYNGYPVAALQGSALTILMQAVVITLAIFVGLSLVVFITKKDFSFMRGALVICSFALLGVALASILFGFTLGALFSGFVILLMAGYILYETSAIMKDFPPTMYVAAALMLFTTVATLFWHVLRVLIALRSE